MLSMMITSITLSTQIRRTNTKLTPTIASRMMRTPLECTTKAMIATRIRTTNRTSASIAISYVVTRFKTTSLKVCKTSTRRTKSTFIVITSKEVLTLMIISSITDPFKNLSNKAIRIIATF